MVVVVCDSLHPPGACHRPHSALSPATSCTPSVSRVEWAYRHGPLHTPRRMTALTARHPPNRPQRPTTSSTTQSDEDVVRSPKTHGTIHDDGHDENAIRHHDDEVRTEGTDGSITQCRR